MLQAPEHPGAQPPARAYNFNSDGLRLRLHEWGDAYAPPLVLCHGMWDHARGFDTLAPLLADRFRVIALDSRGHGDSAWVDGYVWSHDIADIIRVVRWLDGPVHLLGHSRGGALVSQAAVFTGDVVTKVVNLDGFGPPRIFSIPGTELSALPGTPGGLTAFMDGRREAHTRMNGRAYPLLDDLVARRKRQNPRLSDAWLRYFCWHGSHHTRDGFRWKVDPLHGIGAGPFKPAWIGPTLATLQATMLAVIGAEQDTWGPIESDVREERLAFIQRVERVTIANAGHFIHMEQPESTARVVLDFLSA